MKRPALMGIVNVTPDSFSGDGMFADAAVRHAERLVIGGADIIDIGAESTRPWAEKLSADEEWARLDPVLSAIVAQRWRMRARLSVDTRHAQTAARALEFGVEMINDVGGLSDLDMLAILSAHECDIVVMNALDVPADQNKTLPVQCDVVAEILRWKQIVTQRAAAHGIAPQRLIYDPGIGFGKTPQQSLVLILSAVRLRESGGRWLYGHSRKSFMKLLSEADSAARDDITLAFSAQLAHCGVDYLRVHAVARHAELLDSICT